MAYDPKSYLDKALKTGFQPVYGGPQSSEDTNLVYQGDAAKFGNVEVRPVSDYVGSDDQFTAVPSGYMVSVPLTGEYEGYHRNDSYDNDGNFLHTTISEPPESFGTALTNFALTAASFGGFGPIATAAANAYKGINAAKSGDWLSAAASILPGVGVIPGVDKGLADTLKTVGGYAKTGSTLQKAIENKDILGLLESTSGIPGAPKVPTELTDVLKGVGQANKLREAINSGNPEALFREVVGFSKTGVPFSKLADVTGEDAIEGFFDRGGEGYYEGTIIPDWDILPEARTTFTPGSDDVYEDIESLLARYENQGFADTPSGATDQSIDITGEREGTIIPDWDILPDVVTTPRSIRDIGNVTKIAPGEKLEGTEIKEPDLAAGLKPAVTGGTKPGATKPASSGPNLDSLMKALMLMQQRPQEQKEQYQLANMPDYEDLMYGLSSGQTPYMRG
jgi:hypothetical protein